MAMNITTAYAFTTFPHCVAKISHFIPEQLIIAFTEPVNYDLSWLNFNQN
jgi:hypothetical protein